MINIEDEILNIIAPIVHRDFPGSCVVSVPVKSPPQFPFVSIVETDNTAYDRTQTSSSVENHASVTYEVNIYSNKAIGKKSECKAIASLIDNEFATLGFSRTMLQPIPNFEDTNIYRIVGRYMGVVSKEKIVYRR